MQRCVFALTPVGNGDIRVVRHVVEQLLHLTLDVIKVHGGRRACNIVVAASLQCVEPDRFAGGFGESGVSGIVVVVVVATVRPRGRSGYRTRDPGHAPHGRRSQSLRNVHLGRYHFGLFHDGLSGRGTQRRVHDVAVVVTGKVSTARRRRFTLEERGERMGLIEVRIGRF